MKEISLAKKITVTVVHLIVAVFFPWSAFADNCGDWNGGQNPRFGNDYWAWKGCRDASLRAQGHALPGDPDYWEKKLQSMETDAETAARHAREAQEREKRNAEKRARDRAAEERIKLASEHRKIGTRMCEKMKSSSITKTFYENIANQYRFSPRSTNWNIEEVSYMVNQHILSSLLGSQTEQEYLCNLTIYVENGVCRTYGQIITFSNGERGFHNPDRNPCGRNGPNNFVLDELLKLAD